MPAQGGEYGVKMEDGRTRSAGLTPALRPGLRLDASIRKAPAGSRRGLNVSLGGARYFLSSITSKSASTALPSSPAAAWPLGSPPMPAKSAPGPPAAPGPAVWAFL